MTKFPLHIIIPSGQPIQANITLLVHTYYIFGSLQYSTGKVPNYNLKFFLIFIIQHKHKIILT